MSVYKGREGTAKFGGSVIGEIQDWKVEINANLQSSTRMGDVFTKDESVHSSWSGEMQVFWDPADAGQTAMFGGTDIIGNRGTLILYVRGLAGFPSVNITGTVTVENMGLAQAHDGLVGRTFKFKGYGAPTLTGV